MHVRTIGLVTLLAMGGSGFVHNANAQQAPVPPAQAQPSPPVQVDEAKLNSFVVAYLAVDRVGKEFAPRLQGAATPEAQANVRREAGEAMMEAVESSQNISVDEYNTIVEQAQADPELANRINAKLREAPQ